MSKVHHTGMRVVLKSTCLTLCKKAYFLKISTFFMNENWAPCLIGSQEGKKKGQFWFSSTFYSLAQVSPSVLCWKHHTRLLLFLHNDWSTTCRVHLWQPAVKRLCVKLFPVRLFRTAASASSTNTSSAPIWASTSDTSSSCASGVAKTSTWNSTLMSTWRHTQVRNKCGSFKFHKCSGKITHANQASVLWDNPYGWNLWTFCKNMSVSINLLFKCRKPILVSEPFLSGEAFLWNQEAL